MYSINKIQIYKSNVMFIKIQSIYINDNIIFQAKQSIECNIEVAFSRHRI